MIRTALPRALAASLLTLALAANAAPVFLIDATTDGLAPDPGLSNVGFSLTYEDFNFDSLFSLNELLAFTGVFDAGGNYFDSLLGLPTVAGITSGNALDWRFGDSQAMLPDYTAPAGAFTPFATLLVPEPGALALCFAGLAALGLTHRPATRRGSAGSAPAPMRLQNRRHASAPARPQPHARPRGQAR